MAFKPVKVGVIGCGNISYTYLRNLANKYEIIDLVGAADLVPEKSAARAEMFGFKQMTTEEILADPEIEIVVNLTEIFNHTKVSRMIIEAGKHCYSEKLMALNLEDAKETLRLAKEKGVRFGAAPDTWMGSAFQTARKLIDDGMIGEPIYANAVCLRAHRAGIGEGYAPAHFGPQGTTIPFDMGGYYVNALLSMLGRINRVSGFHRFKGDTVYSNVKHPAFGQKLREQEGSTMEMGALEFENGCYGTLVIYGESWGPEVPHIEIFGTKGNLFLPDPNCYGGWHNKVYLSRVGNDGKYEIPLTHGYSDEDWNAPTLTGKWEPCYNSNRGIGVADMAYAIRQDRKHRASEEMAYHCLETICGIEKSCNENIVYKMESPFERAKPLAPGFVLPQDQEASLIF